MNEDNFILDEAGNFLNERDFTAAQNPKTLVSNTTGVMNESMKSCINPKYQFIQFITSVVNGTEDMMFGSMVRILASFGESNHSDD